MHLHGYLNKMVMNPIGRKWQIAKRQINMRLILAAASNAALLPLKIRIKILTVDNWWICWIILLMFLSWSIYIQFKTRMCSSHFGSGTFRKLLNHPKLWMCFCSSAIYGKATAMKYFPQLTIRKAKTEVGANWLIYNIYIYRIYIYTYIIYIYTHVYILNSFVWLIHIYTYLYHIIYYLHKICFPDPYSW